MNRSTTTTSRPHELQIDECRNSSDYTIKVAIAKLYRTASATELIPVFKALADAKPVFEARPGPLLHLPVVGHAQGRAAEELADGVAGRGGGRRHVRPLRDHRRVRRRRRATPPRSPGSRLRGCRRPLRHQDRFQGPDGEREERPREDASPREAAQAAVDEVWGWLTQYNFTANGRRSRRSGCFRDVMNAGSRTLGFCDETGVYVADDQASARGKPLLKTALEECIHWVTKAGDNSRDLQDCAFRLIVEILA